MPNPSRAPFCVRITQAFALGAAVVLGGCAIAPSAMDAPSAEAYAPARLVPYFSLSGRISVRQDQRGEAGQLRWTNSRDAQRIVLSSPLGQVVAQLEQFAGADAELRTGSETRRAGGLAELTRDVLGTAVPIHDLAFWLQGHVDPASGDAVVATRDEHGRPESLNHAGWEIVLEDFRSIGDAVVATRLTARRGDTVVKLVVDDWKALP